VFFDGSGIFADFFNWEKLLFSGHVFFTKALLNKDLSSLDQAS
jgi:hypothetical protein